jgi:hypothetical protein
MAVDPTKPEMPDQGATALGKSPLAASSEPKGDIESDVPDKFKRREFGNKVVHSAAHLTPQQLDKFSEDGWEMHSVIEHNNMPGTTSYYFRRRNK